MSWGETLGAVGGDLLSENTAKGLSTFWSAANNPTLRQTVHCQAALILLKIWWYKKLILNDILCVHSLCSKHLCAFQSKERRTRVKDSAKKGASKTAGGREGGHFSRGQNTKIPFLGLSLLRNQMETLATHSSVPIEIVHVIFTLWMDFSCMAIQSFEWSQGWWGTPSPSHRWYKQLLGLTCNSRSCLAPIIHSQQDTAVDMEHSVKSSVGHQQMLWSRRRSTTERRCFWYYMFSCNSWFN